MNLHRRNTVRGALAGVGLISLLTACPRPTPPPPYASFNLTFKFPPLPASANLGNTYLAAIAFDADTGAISVVNSQSLGYGAPGGSQSNTVQLNLYGLDGLLNGTVYGQKEAKKINCSQAFAKGEADGIKDIKVTPEGAKTCNVYFVIFEDKDGNRSPSNAEEIYMTHDIVSYASSPLTFSYGSEDGHSAVSGSRNKGWSLVRHQVLQPTSTPGQYLVSMNSAPAEDQAIAINMHVPSAFYTSQSLPSAQLGGSQK
ncbi:hypothetical protein FNU79_02800 [Deinococcus detaillensis]|uniref:Uncharacterized protein n=1 Tax=Deinococcus detaillensis TaxID=2592048 RepID=A0A553V4L6_9DEIO|nr:hypothetical protein [Deinococcus detaillensis]TSA87430.1 hypothetical protein FNU79_02800 [Deinococcus detaillensis]